MFEPMRQQPAIFEHPTDPATGQQTGIDPVRDVIELAIATRTAPSQWWDEPAEIIATAWDVLAERAKREQAAIDAAKRG